VLRRYGLARPRPFAALDVALLHATPRPR
jgi:hypothetical protein